MKLSAILNETFIRQESTSGIWNTDLRYHAQGLLHSYVPETKDIYISLTPNKKKKSQVDDSESFYISG